MNITTKKLNSGAEIPVLGFGTWQVEDGTEAEEAVTTALEVGYRHIDTAQIYENETSVGKAIAKSGVPRKELFLTTKLWNENQFYQDVLPSFEESLQKLQTDYVDLFLVHFPVPETRDAAWLRMVEILESGRAKAIGVSNYTERHLQQLFERSGVRPAVNQVEVHPFLVQQSLRDFCATNRIVVEAYSPLAHGADMTNEAISRIASAQEKSYAQIMLRWAVQLGMVVLPKSTHRERIQENAEIFEFELTDDEITRISALDRNLRTCWSPEHTP